MSAPTQLTITVLVYSSANPAVITTSAIVIAIPAALTALDSTVQGATQTGYSAVDQLVRAIFRAGVFTDGKGTWYSANTILTVTSS